MNGKYLLDTNIIIALFADELEVKENLSTAGEVFLSSVAIGELCYGARKSGKPEENLSRINVLTSNNVVLGCDTETARKYGELKHRLQVKGRPLPENDIWIAAIALQHNLILVSRDAHFQEVEDLSTDSWQTIKP